MEWSGFGQSEYSVHMVLLRVEFRGKQDSHIVRTTMCRSNNTWYRDVTNLCRFYRALSVKEILRSVLYLDFPTQVAQFILKVFSLVEDLHYVEFPPVIQAAFYDCVLRLIQNMVICRWGLFKTWIDKKYPSLRFQRLFNRFPETSESFRGYMRKPEGEENNIEFFGSFSLQVGKPTLL